MKISKILTDAAILQELGRRIASVRLNRNLTQAQLATLAAVSKRTIERLESGAVATQLSAFVRICRALELLDALGTLLPEPAPSPISLVRMRGKVRRRASRLQVADAPPTPWTWSDNS